MAHLVIGQIGGNGRSLIGLACITAALAQGHTVSMVSMEAGDRERQKKAMEDLAEAMLKEHEAVIIDSLPHKWPDTQKLVNDCILPQVQLPFRKGNKGFRPKLELVKKYKRKRHKVKR